MTETAFFQTAYDRAACEIGIVHLGFGAFHRAHQAVYVDDYMQATGDLRWGIAAVNLRAAESAEFALAAEATATHGYLLKSIAPDGTIEFRVVRSHGAFVDAAKDLDAALSLFESPSLSVISVTVTESGYWFKDDWRLDVTAPSIQADLAGGHRQTIYGFLAAALARRAAASDAPLSILCCDNIRSNGRVVEAAMLSYLEAAGAEDLTAWVTRNVRFPCSMVDRITPRSSPELQEEVQRLFPGLAAAPVHAEAFSQWVLEDRFAGPVPDLAAVGVRVVADVEPYEEAKIRILNGGHVGLAYLGALAGHTTFDQAMAHPELRAHFDAWEQDEVLPGLGPDIPFDTSAYLASISLRFENSGIADQLERICTDGYSKMGIYVRPTLAASRDRGGTPKRGYDCIASWVVFARRAFAGHSKVPYHDAYKTTLAPMLAPGEEGTLASDRRIWGDLPERFSSFVPDLVGAIQRMEERWQD